MDLTKVRCECGKLLSPSEIVQHTFQCAVFHKRWGSKIIGARYEKRKRTRRKKRR